MKNVLIVFTGGTFSMKIDEKTKAAVPFFQGEELVDMIPEARGLANLSIYEFGNYPGPHITPQRMLELSEKINSFIEQNTFDGIIVKLEKLEEFRDEVIKKVLGEEITIIS